MLLIVLILLALIGVFLLRRILAGRDGQTDGRFKTMAWAVGLIALLLLLATGRLNVVLAAIGVALAYLIRVLPILLNHAPSLHRLWQLFTQAKGHGSQPGQQPFRPSGKMSAEEAYQILGLQPGASPEEIIAAHRKLMQKNHPDHGGSVYLATQINLAKKTLISK